MNISRLGWVVAAALGAVLCAGGFQGKSDKFVVVDMEKVFHESAFAKAQTDNLRALNNSRLDMLQFVRTYPVFTAEQASRFKELSMKANPTAPEKAELEGIKKAVMDANKKFQDLSTKQNPTTDEVSQMKEFMNRSQTMASTMDRWAHEFEVEVGTMQSTLNGQTLDRVRAAIKEVGAKQGCTLVLTADSAPYGSTDITDETLKAMNAKK
jgi:Skp family chaperone for outer membrane proteins